MAATAAPDIGVRAGPPSLGPENAVSPARRASSAAEAGVVAHHDPPPQRRRYPPRLRRRRFFSGRRYRVEGRLLLPEQSMDGVSQQEPN